MSDLKIDAERVFEEEKPSFDDLMQKIPDGLREYIQGIKMIADGFTDQQKQVRNDIQPWTPLEFEFAIDQIEIGNNFDKRRLQAKLNEGWHIDKTVSHEKWLLVIMSRERKPDGPPAIPAPPSIPMA